jgi:hypothetical protein
MDDDERFTELMLRTARNLERNPPHKSPPSSYERRYAPEPEPEEPKPTSSTFARNFAQQLAEQAATMEQGFNCVADLMGRETGKLLRELEALTATVEDLRGEVSLLRTVGRARGVPINGATNGAS